MFRKGLFIIISIILMVMVYITSMLGIIYGRQAVALDEILDRAVLNQDFTEYIKYSTKNYQELTITDVTDNGLYSVSVFRTIEVDADGTLSKLAIFIIPLSDVTMSETDDDPLDLTSLKLYAGAAVIYDTKNDPDYETFSVSYGLRQAGFYYYLFEPLQNGPFEIELKDYSGNLFFDGTVTFPYDIDLTDSNVLLANGFLPSFTTSEIEELLNLNASMWKVYMYLGIFLAIDFTIGFFVFRKK